MCSKLVLYLYKTSFFIKFLSFVLYFTFLYGFNTRNYGHVCSKIKEFAETKMKTDMLVTQVLSEKQNKTNIMCNDIDT